MIERVNENRGWASASSASAKVQDDNPVLNKGYKVLPKQTIYKLQKAFNFISEADFRKYAGLSGTAQLKAGEYIKVPNVKIETTFFSIAAKYNMSVNALKALNPQIKDFQKIKKGTIINVPYKPFKDKDTSEVYSLSNNNVPQAKQKENKPNNTASPVNIERENKPADNTSANTKAVQFSDYIRVGSNGKPESPSTKIKLNSGTFTLGQLQKDAKISGEKEFKTKFGLNNSVKRTLPLLNDSNTRIVTDVSEVMSPTASGKLNGKLILVNAGHGGYIPKNGYYDPGAIGVTKQKKSDGGVINVPLEENVITSRYADDLIIKLRANGAKVIRIQGSVDGMADGNVLEKISKKYGTNNTMFISFHCDAEEKTGTGILFNPHDQKDVKLAEVMNKALNSDSWIKSETYERPYKYTDPKTKKVKEKGNLHVLNATKGMPSVLLEIEYMNGERKANLTSLNFQKRFNDSVLKGVLNYYNE